MRHIPKSATTEVELLPFPAALTAALRPCSDYDVDRWLYVPNAYAEYRYILGTRGRRPLICVGINPSTAAPDRLDNTLRSVERVALGNGYDSFLMCNLYAQRATDPDSLEQSCNRALHRENLAAFQYLLTRCPQPAVWAAWGAIIEKRAYLGHCLGDFIALGAEYGARWYCAGPRSKKGHPHHPLYLRRDVSLEPFDAQQYATVCLTATR